MADLLVVIPAYNEEQTISGVVREVREELPRACILVVDDGSVDLTAHRAAEAGAKVVKLPINLGTGAAVQTGFAFAVERGHSLVVQIDADGQHPPGAIERLLAPIEDGSADVTIGSRFLEAGGYKTTHARRLGIRLLVALCRLLSRAPVTDPTSGFRAYNARAVAMLCRDYPSDYPEVEAVVKIVRNGLRLKEVPVEMRMRQGGKSSITFSRSLYYLIKVALATFTSRFKPKSTP